MARSLRRRAVLISRHSQSGAFQGSCSCRCQERCLGWLSLTLLLIAACSGPPGEPTPVPELATSSASPSPGGLLQSTAASGGHGSVPCVPPGPVHGGPSPSKWIGSDVATDYGGAAVYPKAQSFFARANTVRRVDVHLQNTATRPWTLRIVTALPQESSATPGRMSSTDLQSKTLGLVRVRRTPAGWVSAEFCPPVSLRSGQRYYLVYGCSRRGCLHTWKRQLEWLQGRTIPRSVPWWYGLDLCVEHAVLG